jgi:rubrerythrin
MIATQQVSEPRLRALRDCKSLAAVIDTAMAFEKHNQEFYTNLVQRVPAEIRPLVRQLATEARTQLRRLSVLSRDRDLAEHLDHCVERPETCTDFAGYATLPQLPDDALDDDILEYALNMERLAFEHYGYLFDRTPEGPLKDLFAHLAKEKQRRIALLQRRWASLFSVL